MNNKSFYFCTECKKNLQSLEDLLFVEENSHKGFCGHECIEDFYSPLIRYFEVLEHTLRRKYHLLEESSNQIITESSIEEALNFPDEVTKYTNELSESYYSFIKNFSDYSVVVIASVYQLEASFIFLNMKTSSKQLVGEFRFNEDVGHLFKGISQNQSQHIFEETEEKTEFSEEDDDIVFMQYLESKKSKILADVLMKRKDEDIKFEEFNQYDYCFQETLDQPDEVFEYKDNEGDVIFFYLKSFSSGGLSHNYFTYIISAIKHNSDLENVNVYPILAIPSTDHEFCQEFRKGIRLTNTLKN